MLGVQMSSFFLSLIGIGRSPADVERWVYEAVSDGASSIFTYVAREMCNPEDAAKVRAFIRAAKQIKKLLDDGCRREDISGLTAVLASPRMTCV